MTPLTPTRPLAAPLPVTAPLRRPDAPGQAVAVRDVVVPAAIVGDDPAGIARATGSERPRYLRPGALLDIRV